MADVSLARAANIFRAQENEFFLQTRLKNSKKTVFLA